jgi:hypothetical protein
MYKIHNPAVEQAILFYSFADPDPHDTWYVFRPSGSFYQQAKIVRKTLIPTVFDFFMTFFLRKNYV